MSFEDYHQLVLKEYQQKKENGTLSNILCKPTNATLRDEILKLLNERWESYDVKIFNDFFGDFTSKAELFSLIRKMDVDDNRPIINFLKNKITHPKEKIVNMVAYLINFQNRPYRYEMEISKGENGKEVDGKEMKSKKEDVVYPFSLAFSNVYSSKFAKYILGLTLLSAVLVSSFNLFYEEKCMVWNGETFEKISCDEKKIDQQIIAFDEQKVGVFRKITKPDTITLASAGKLWYSKKNNKVEYFTAPGTHPEDVNRYLKPLTKYMIETHILKPNSLRN
ncbi:hypothetical protein [Pedobacter flavus]|uniref:Anti-sigma factor n=1 Tax=Pedobacter flavus TaxID=3113906 RepID=A0ABU7H374_9SPHI|nr:hypothetical protein [Pedobacter sp. VNH31]MEE1885705.1 hypothetical protein [Pedobacter sp. VNH31]